MLRTTSLILLCLGLLGLGTARPALAETPGEFAAAMGLSAADGSVRTQTSVRMSLSPPPGTDFVMLMSAPIQARLPEVRACFAAAMAANPRAEGRVVLQVEATARGRTKVEVALDETGEPKLASCMRHALLGADLRKVKGTKPIALVALELTNPGASVRAAMAQKSSEAQAVPVQQVGGGRVHSEGGTYAGEVRFELTTSAFAKTALERLHRDLNARLPGLIDCRRKSARRGIVREGAIALDLSLDRGRAVRTRTVSSELADRTAPQCISAWIGKAVSAADGPSEIALTVHFAR